MDTYADDLAALVEALDLKNAIHLGVFFAPKGITSPVAVSAFPDELYQGPRSWKEKACPKLIHFNRLPKDTHFAAWEQPEFFVSELRAAFKSLR
jgi:pimeloyl-ACP methyl ester carboxylesterase